MVNKKNKLCKYCYEEYSPYDKTTKFCSRRCSADSKIESYRLINKFKMTHICSKCKIEKFKTEFSKRSDKRIGIKLVCKECSNKISNNKNYKPIMYGELKCNKCDIVQNVKQFRECKRLPCGRNKICKNCCNAYSRKKHKNLEVKLLKNYRTRLRNAMSGISKSDRTMHLIGCSMIELIDYIERQFTHNMSWQLFMSGEIHIDHIMPCSSFNLSDSLEQKKCFHYTNLQPMFAKENLKKSDNILYSMEWDGHKWINHGLLKEIYNYE